MHEARFYYLIKIQFLGYRLHGWQRQPNLKTVEGLVKKTLKFVLPKRRFKILGSSRTDAMVSANEAAMELFLFKEPLAEQEEFLQTFNKNLPQDIRALSVQEVDAAFNIIQHPKLKEYLYLFSFGGKNHPFCAPLMANFQEDLDINNMKIGARLFEGEHNFGNYTVAPSEKTKSLRLVKSSSIEENISYTASFFPKESHILRVTGRGFLRYQIRLMMGTLIQLGRGEITLDQIEESLQPGSEMQMTYIAPASGLILNKIEFE